MWLFGLFLFLGNGISVGSSFVKVDLSGNQSIIAVIILFFLAMVYFRAQAGIISCIKAVLDKQITSFTQGLAAGRLFQWRLLGVAMIMNAGLFALTMIIISPIFYLYHSHLLWRAGILSGLGLAILIPTSIIVALISVMAPMFIVFYDLKIGEAIRQSFELVREFWLRLLVFSLLLFGINLLVSAGSIFVLLLYLAYHKVGLIVAGSLILLMVQPVLTCFAQTAWVLAFQELIKPQKFEEEKVVATAVEPIS